MKSILLITCFTLFSLTAFCQDYCNDIEKKIGPDGSIVYRSKPHSAEPISVWKIHSRLSMIFRFYAAKHVAETGLFITMSDGSKLTSKYSFIGSYPSHTGKGFGCEAIFPIADKDINKLTSKYIVKFSVGNLGKNVPKIWGIRYMNYVQCIKNKAG